MKEFYGKHFFAELSGIPLDLIEDVNTLLKITEKSIVTNGATIVESKCYYFDPIGYTFFVVLKESHVSIHAYPEHNSLFLDVFTCGKTIQAQNIMGDIINYLKPQKQNTHYISRDAP